MASGRLPTLKQVMAAVVAASSNGIAAGSSTCKPDPPRPSQAAWLDRGEFVLDLASAFHEFVVGLQAEEKPLGHPEVAGQPQVGVGRHRPLAEDEFVDAARWYADSGASSFWLSSIGFRNSPSRISPGCGLVKEASPFMR